LRSGLRRQVYGVAGVGALAVLIVIIWQPLNVPLSRLLYRAEPQQMSAYLAAMDWLAKNSADDALILNTEQTDWVAPYTGRAAVFYAIPDGYQATAPQDSVAAFWQGDAVDLSAAGVDYILYDGSVDAPAALEALQVVFEQEQVRVYQVGE
jgi:hypothetical protein